MTTWLDNGKCSRKKGRTTADHDQYVSVNGGHVFARYGDYELDEIDAGSQCVSVPCVNCGEWVCVNFANNNEHENDDTPYIPDEKHWRRLNQINSPN